jgi:hypothetical protein
MIEEIKTKARPRIEKYSELLNNLVDRMLKIEVNDRITIDEILDSVDCPDYCVQQIIEAH